MRNDRSLRAIEFADFAGLAGWPAIFSARPVVFSVDQGDWYLDRRVCRASVDPCFPLPTEGDKCTLVAWQRAAGPEFIDEIRRKAAGIVDAALHHFSKHALSSNPENQWPDRRQEHGREQHICKR